MNLGFFCELLSEDSAEKITGENGEEEKGDEGHDKKGNVDAIRKRPERMSQFFSFREYR